MTLLPQNYFNIFKKEKRIRLFSALCVFLIFILLVGVTFVLPSYFALLFSSSDILRRTDTEEISLKRKDVSSVENNIASINSMLDSYFTGESSRQSFSSVFVPVVNSAPETIKLANIEFQKDSSRAFVFHLRGNAEKRNDLILFSQKIRELPQVKELRSPVSNLLQETNIKFLLEVLVNDQYYDYKN